MIEIDYHLKDLFKDIKNMFYTSPYIKKINYRSMVGIIFIILTLLMLPSQTANAQIDIINGLEIRQNTKLKSGEYQISPKEDLDDPIITIKGNNLDLDFENIVLRSDMDVTQPHLFTGLAILIDSSSNIRIRNLQVHGFKVALMIKNSDHIELINGDLSFNFRQKLFSTRKKESLTDWLSYHANEADEWLRYGAAVYLKNCTDFTIKGLQIHQGQNGIMLVQCERGLIYNCQITFNSGIGIGLYRSSNNKVLSNNLDWNVRGYSHGFYQRGQDSAGILVYESSHKNLFAFNSATHSGDGFFLWAGNEFMNTAKGACNDNIIFSNDFSFAPTNGIEVTFSSNRLINNKMEECRYGIWGGYSYDTRIMGNKISHCDFGIAIENGHDNIIQFNKIKNTNLGIQIWDRGEQPKSWPFTDFLDVSSRNYDILFNDFDSVQTGLKIEKSNNIQIQYNIYENGVQFLVENNNENVKVIPDYSNTTINNVEFKFAKPIPNDTISARGQFSKYDGRENIIMNEWGPYDFSYPLAHLEKEEDQVFHLRLMGPIGKWEVRDQIGFLQISEDHGNLPQKITAKGDGSEIKRIDFIFHGEAFTDQFGLSHPSETFYPFRFNKQDKVLDWTVQFFNENPKTELQDIPLDEWQNRKPDLKMKTNDIDFRWWGSPADGINSDGFFCHAYSEAHFAKGRYKFTISSDDGIIFKIDGKTLYDNWTIHVPESKELIVALDGKHKLELLHFEQSGLATLDLQMMLIDD